MTAARHALLFATGFAFGGLLVALARLVSEVLV